jgi:hypothetical protein
MSNQARENMSKSRKGKMPNNYNDFILHAKGKIYINDGVMEKRIFPEQKDEYPTWSVGRIKYVCPYCNISSDIVNLKRWHNEKCKFKKV